MNPKSHYSRYILTSRLQRLSNSKSQCRVKPLFKPYNNSTDGFTIARVCVCECVSVYGVHDGMVIGESCAGESGGEVRAVE